MLAETPIRIDQLRPCRQLAAQQKDMVHFSAYRRTTTLQTRPNRKE